MNIIAMKSEGQDVANIVFGNTLSDDGHPHRRFDYMLSNPPFGVEWKKVEKEVRKEHASQLLIGRQGALCGNINYADGKFWASEHAVVVSPIQKVVKKWLGEMLRTMNLNSTLSHFQFGVCGLWIPAFAGMTVTFFQRIFCFVIPAKAGIQSIYSNMTK